MNLKKQIHFNTHMGRMGNQMFQYACALELAHLGYTTSLSHLDKIDHFELGFLERQRNRVRSFLFFRLWKKLWGLNIINTELKCLSRSYIEELQSIQSPTMVWGFFQSPSYFPHVFKQLKQNFRVKSKFRQSFHRFLESNQLTPGSYIAIHIRQTDYKGFTVPGLAGDDFTLPTSYYTNVFARINRTSGKPVVFVSDAPGNVEALFPGIPDKIISDNDAVTDFLILQNAGIIVSSNSTFAWWAAFLNEYAGEEIYCPEFFLGFKENKEVPLKIYPEHWQQVPVF